MIEIVEIQVGKQLRCKVPDRQTFSFPGKKEAFRLRQSDPIAPVTLHFHVFRRIIENDLPNKPKKQVPIDRNLGGIPIDQREYLVVHDFPVYRHEIPAYVETENVTFVRMVPGTGPNKMFGPLHAIRSSLSFPATVTIVYEYAFAERIQVSEYEMMNDSVPKRSGEYFPLHGSKNDETGTRGHPIFPIDDLASQFEQLLFEVHLELGSLFSLPFMLSGFVICLEQIK